MRFSYVPCIDTTLELKEERKRTATLDGHESFVDIWDEPLSSQTLILMETSQLLVPPSSSSSAAAAAAAGAAGGAAGFPATASYSSASPGSVSNPISSLSPSPSGGIGGSSGWLPSSASSSSSVSYGAAGSGSGPSGASGSSLSGYASSASNAHTNALTATFKRVDTSEQLFAIKAATLNKLVERSTLTFVKNAIAQDVFVETLLMTYRSFTTGSALYERLMQRYNVPSYVIPIAAEAVKDRVAAVVTQWVDTHFPDFTTMLLDQVRQFVRRLREDLLAERAHALQRVLAEKVCFALFAFLVKYGSNLSSTHSHSFYSVRRRSNGSIKWSCICLAFFSHGSVGGEAAVQPTNGAPACDDDCGAAEESASIPRAVTRLLVLGVRGGSSRLPFGGGSRGGRADHGAV